MGSGNGQHPYQACRDSSCEKYACRVWKEAWDEAYREGRDDGYKAGYDDGRKDGYREGYDKGFPDGMASCPRNHSG
jgi:flagellar biosynthesis/type III secretory pathway protein FliH